MQQFGASVFYMVVHWHKLYEVDIFLSSWLSVCQKLSNLVEFWRSSDKNKLDHFFDTPCSYISANTILDPNSFHNLINLSLNHTTVCQQLSSRYI